MRIALVAAMLLLLSGTGVFAELQPTSPRAEKQKPEVNKTYNADRQDKKPETTIITKQPTTNNPQNGTNIQPPEDKNLIVNQKIAKYTGFLALLAFLQFVAMAIQAGFLSKTLGATKEAAEAAKKSAEVAENALTLLERPYVFAFGVSQFHLSTERLEPALSYDVANFGKTPAIIERVQAEIENIKSNLDALIEVDRWHELVSTPILGAGEIRKRLTVDVPLNMLSFNNITPDLKHGDDLFFRIIITYRGTFTKGHESSFCWRYSRHASCFEPYGHEKYNYTR